MKYKYRNRQFWCRGYYVDTTGKNTKKIKEYIANQLNEDRIAEQMTLEDIDPFTGSKQTMQVADCISAVKRRQYYRAMPANVKPLAKLVDIYYKLIEYLIKGAK